MAHDPKPGWRVPEMRVLSQADYNELPLFEQYRYLCWLGGHFRRKAGPMDVRFRDGRPVNQATWDKYTPKAEVVEAEAQRLSMAVRGVKVKHEHTTHFAQVDPDLSFMRDAA